MSGGEDAGVQTYTDRVGTVGRGGGEGPQIEEQLSLRDLNQVVVVVGEKLVPDCKLRAYKCK